MPLTPRHNPKTTKEYIFSRVITVTESGCWLWDGTPTQHGYCRIDTGKNGKGYAHRASWIAHNGPIPEGKLVLHKCDERSCVNPYHLFLGDHQENMRDASRKLRLRHGKGVNTNKLTEDQVRTIRASEESCTKLNSVYGVSHSTIARIKRGEIWGWLK